MLNVKLDPAAKAEIESAAELLGMTVSEFVRAELRAAVARVRKAKAPTAWALLQRYVGKYQAEDASLSSRSPRALVRQRYRGKRTR